MLELFGSNQIVDACERVVTYIRCQRTERPLLIVPVLDGALPFFGVVARHLGFGTKSAVVFDYESVVVSAYESNKVRKPTEIVKPLKGDWSKHQIVVLDDVFDGGGAASALVSMFRKQYNINDYQLSICFLVSKQKKYQPYFEFRDIHCFAPLQANPEDWLVGFGMDDNYKDRGLCEIRKK